MRDIDDRLSRGGAAVRGMAQEVPIGTSDRITHNEVGESRRRVGLVVAVLALLTGVTATVVFLDPNQATDVGDSAPSIGLSDTDLRVFFPVGTSDDQLTQAVALALTWPGVTHAQGFDSAAALDEFSQLFAGCPELVEVASRDVGAFPASVGLWVEGGTDIAVLSETARTALAAFGPVTVSVTEHAPPVDCTYPPVDELGITTIPGITVLTPLRIECIAELSKDFPCTALIDGDPTTTWQAPDGGIGVTITFTFAEPVQITDLAFENEPDISYKRNVRVRGVTVTTDDLSQPIAFELADTNAAPQVFDIRSLRTSELTVQITSGYPGQSVGDQAPFTDLAVGEITVSGRLAPTAAVTTTTEANAAAATNWLGAGQLVSDEAFLALRPGLEPIPGTTVIRLAWTSAYNDQYDLGLFAYMSTTPDPSDDADIWYCLLESASLSGSDPPQAVAGSGQCAETLEEFHEMLAFGVGMGGSCVEPLTWVTAVWGVPELVETVVFHMSDGTELLAEVTNGIAQVAWGSDIVVTTATFAGITEEQTAKLREIYDYAQSCADLNDPGGGGG